MLVEMSRVRLIGLKEHFFDVIDVLHSFGRVHFEDIGPSIEKGDLPITRMRLFERSQRERDALVDASQRTRAVVKGLFGDADMPTDGRYSDNELLRLGNAELIERMGSLLQVHEPAAAELVGHLESLEKQLAELTRYEPLLEKIEPIAAELIDSDDKDAVALLVERRFKPVLNEFDSVLARSAGVHARVVQKDVDEDNVAAVVVFERQHAAKVRQFLAGENINQIKLPDEFESVPLTEALTAIRARMKTLPDDIVAAAADVAAYAESHRSDLVRMRNATEDRVAELESISMFGETRYSFVITGWVPTRDMDELRDAIASRWPESVVVEQCEISPHDYSDVPVAMENKSSRKPFELALGIWGLPKYGSIDPTPWLAVGFPFIFGMIVGDAGYGLLLLLICLFLRFRLKENVAAQVFSGLMLPAAVWTMLFGVFYFEFFGDLAHVYLPGLNQIHPVHISDSFSIPFVRTSKSMLNTFLVMAIGFGVLHVVVGLILGVVNGRRGKHRSHVIERSGLLTMSLAVILLVFVMAVPALTAGLGDVGAAAAKYLAYLLLAAGFVATLWGGGIMGAVETIETVSHMASYIRIMAVGLVGALLADAANELAFVSMPNAGGVVIALMLHVLNFAVILFSPTIHALRLNFLEFFGGFFDRGTKLYRPFVRTGEEG